MDAIVTEED